MARGAEEATKAAATAAGWAAARAEEAMEAAATAVANSVAVATEAAATEVATAVAGSAAGSEAAARAVATEAAARAAGLVAAATEAVATGSFPNPSSNHSQQRQRPNYPPMRNESIACLRRRRSLRPTDGARAGRGGLGAGAAQETCTGRNQLKAESPRTWERTSNMSDMPHMLVTLDVLKLSGWSNANAPCRVERREYAMRDEVRAERRERTRGATTAQAVCTGCGRAQLQAVGQSRPT